jgi:hypothetical protein
VTRRETLSKAADLAAKARNVLDDARRLLDGETVLCARAAVLFDETDKLRLQIEKEIRHG